MSMGVALAAFWLRSCAALFATIAARFMPNIMDILGGFARVPDAQTLTLLVIFAVILILIPAFGLRWLLMRLRS
ncbi:MAG: hypothetical protein AAF631_02600, partial [Pseudomonadota bacterium]